ncbi:GTP-binding protein EngA [Halorhodospira halochloris]|uniref:GTPase Der n=1 Tax=Halorhodospira halochloris TaxID=1052 RepID=A0A0X8X7Y6_HALHR|nr:ribosome biogenesis GTPase Der [Halorhodospira halochloris]MBK1651512.1 ribosome biogenesis GTPase Der [Halorhodospira halochloris]BAU57224.2 GTP-binding protein EngA [Halorhodospira halochloris]
MRPVIALVGRPNVGKSTLFNRLTRTRDALVANYPGLTRDRQYGVLRHHGDSAIVIDTGGMGEETDGPGAAMHEQAGAAIAEADTVILIVDGQTGVSSGDEEIVAQLRGRGCAVHVAVNKSEGLDKNLVCADFHSLGIAAVHAISALRGRGVDDLIDAVFRDVYARRSQPHKAPEQAGVNGLDEGVDDQVAAPRGAVSVAVVGRPNVGKSTLINRLLGEERVVVYDQPGTTRDSITIPFECAGQLYHLIDTAGVRRRARVDEQVEKLSVIKSLEAIDRANVVLLVSDAREGITEQDAHLAGHVLEAGRALVLVINKWDGLEPDQRLKVKRDLDRRFAFLEFARRHFVSALHGSGVGLLLESVDLAYAAANRDLPTPELNEALHKAIAGHQPPLSRGRRIKPRYAHQGGHNPPRIVIHGNQVQRLPAAYGRYLERFFREEFQLQGTPVRIEYRASDNPFADKPNPLSERQQRRRQRVIRHAKRSKKRKRR